MFAPDEAGNRWRDLDHDSENDLSASTGQFDYNNSWWADWEWGNSGVLDRQIRDDHQPAPEEMAKPSTDR